MRDRIIQKTMEELNVRGIKFTMADLASKLGVSKRTLYENFSSKEELIATIIDTIIDDLNRQDKEAAINTTSDFSENLKRMLAAYPQALGPINDRFIDDMQRYMPDGWRKIETYLELKWQKIENMVLRGMEEGVIKPVNVAVLKKIYLGAIGELFDYRFLTENGIAFNYALGTMAEVFVSGLAKNKPQE